MISNDSMFLNALMFKEKDTLALIFSDFLYAVLLYDLGGGY